MAANAREKFSITGVLSQQPESERLPAQPHAGDLRQAQGQGTAWAGNDHRGCQSQNSPNLL